MNSAYLRLCVLKGNKWRQLEENQSGIWIILCRLVVDAGNTLGHIHLAGEGAEINRSSIGQGLHSKVFEG